MARRDARDGRSLAALLLMGLLCVLVIGTLPLRARADSGGVDVEVEVLGTSASPSPSATDTPTAAGTGAETGAGGGSSTGQPTSGTGAAASSGSTSGSGTTGVPKASASTTPTGETSIAGVLFISGLTMTYTPSVNPLDGRVDMRFTVRNAYRKALSGTAIFWVTAWSGTRLGNQVEVAVPDIAPGETRVVSATVRRVGQWGLLTGHVTFFPPPFLDQVSLTAATRTDTVLYVPWFPVACVALGSAVWLAVRRRGLAEILAALGGRR